MVGLLNRNGYFQHRVQKNISMNVLPQVEVAESVLINFINIS